MSARRRANAIFNRSLIRRRRKRMPYDYRNMRKEWTSEWFLKNRIAIFAVTNHMGNQIKEKCRDMGIMFFLWRSRNGQYSMCNTDATQIQHG